MPLGTASTVLTLGESREHFQYPTGRSKDLTPKSFEVLIACSITNSHKNQLPAGSVLSSLSRIWQHDLAFDVYLPSLLETRDRQGSNDL